MSVIDFGLAKRERESKSFKNSHLPSSRPTAAELLKRLGAPITKRPFDEAAELFDLDEKLSFRDGQVEFDQVIQVRHREKRHLLK